MLQDDHWEWVTLGSYFHTIIKDDKLQDDHWEWVTLGSYFHTIIKDDKLHDDHWEWVTLGSYFHTIIEDDKLVQATNTAKMKDLRAKILAKFCTKCIFLLWSDFSYQHLNTTILKLIPSPHQKETVILSTQRPA